MSKIYAICKTLDAGHETDRKHIERCGIKVGDKFELADAVVFKWESHVYLKGYDSAFNSVFFDYVDEDGKRYDIRRDERFHIKNREERIKNERKE